MTDANLEESLEAVASVLLRCSAIGIGVLLFWFVVYLLFGDFAFEIHTRLFGISRLEFEHLNYYGMAALKLVVFFFYVIPYIAARMTLGKLRAN